METKKYRLKEVLKIGNGKDHSSLGEGIIPVYGSGGFMRNVDSFLYDGESVLLPRKGSLSNIQYVTGKFWTVDTCYYTKIDNTIVDPYFLFILLKSLDLSGFDSGASIPSMTSKTYYGLKVDIPNIETQKKIASYIKKYDSLIELNTKRIKTLEQMAENLYKEWFVRFRFPGHENAEFENGIPNGWEYKTAADLSSVLQRGISPDYDDEGEYTVISQKCIRTNIMDISESRRQTKAFKPELNLQDADTVICSTGTGTLGRVGRVIGSYPNTTFDSHVTLVRAKKNVSKQFLYGALKNTQTWFMNMGIGSTNQQELYISVIRKTKLLVPTDNLMKDYENIVKPIHDNIGILISDNENLIKQRDLLLPRLMSGKLEV